MHALEVKQLTKTFGNFVAVDKVSFNLDRGEILGFLGPNGAGKTTTLQMLMGILTPSAGEIHYFGRDLYKHREQVLERVNFSSTYVGLPETLTLRECLLFVSYLYKIENRRKRIDEVVEIFDLKTLLNQKIGSFSAGQKTRANMAKALLNSPDVLLLDEPTASLDPDIALFIREFLLQERRRSHLSILITSHNMAEIEALCDRVVFIEQGKIIADSTPYELAKTIDVCHVSLLVQKNRRQFAATCKAWGFECRVEDKYVIVDIAEHEVAAFLTRLAQAGIVYTSISIDEPTLEDYFLQTVKRHRV